MDSAGHNLGSGGTRQRENGENGVHVERLRQLIVVTGREVIRELQTSGSGLRCRDCLAVGLGKKVREACVERERSVCGELGRLYARARQVD